MEIHGLKKLFNTETQRGLRAAPGDPLLLGCSLMCAITSHICKSSRVHTALTSRRKYTPLPLHSDERWRASLTQQLKVWVIRQTKSENPRVSCIHVIRMFLFIIRSWLVSVLRGSHNWITGPYLNLRNDAGARNFFPHCLGPRKYSTQQTPDSDMRSVRDNEKVTRLMREKLIIPDLEDYDFKRSAPESRDLTQTSGSWPGSVGEHECIRMLL